MAKIDQTPLGMEIIDPGDAEWGRSNRSDDIYRTYGLLRLETQIEESEIDPIENAAHQMFKETSYDIFVKELDDEHITFGKINDIIGVSDLSVFFRDTTTTEGVVIGNKIFRDAFIRFFIQIQRVTGNKFRIFICDKRHKILEDEQERNNVGFGVHSDGLFPIVHWNNIPEKDHIFLVPVDNYISDDEKTILESVRKASQNLAPNPQPWIFKPYEHEEYQKLIGRYKDKRRREAQKRLGFEVAYIT